MRVCVPVTADTGLGSEVSLHFGSAPCFLLVDSETLAYEAVANGDLGHQHGACQPLKALGDHAVDAIVVGGIGRGALARLNEAGLQVYLARPGTAAEMIAAFVAGELAEVSPDGACGGHAHGHDCHESTIQLS